MMIYIGMTVTDQHATCIIFRAIVSLWVWLLLCMVYTVVLCCAQMHLKKKKKRKYISHLPKYQL